MITRERWKLACIFWYQLGMTWIALEESPAQNCENTAKLCGRLVRYARTFEGNEHEQQKVEDVISQLRRSYFGLSPQTQQKLVQGTKLAVSVTISEEKDRELFLSVVQAELIRSQSAFSKRECTACKLGLVLVDHDPGCPKRRAN